jgi:hypothetical protein
VLSGHFRRDLAPKVHELSPRHLGREILDHARLRFPKGEEAKHYNALQKLTYLSVIVALLPLMILTGLTMSPGVDAALPFLVDIFGGPQSARTIHFITASALVFFVIVHVAMVSLLRLTGLKPTARYLVLHCADELEKTLDGSGRYYESIDLIDAVHPQTILAYQMNGQDLSVGHGAPLRLRVERQLGYKQAKYIMRIELIDSFAGSWGGNGGYWEDRGYEWYAGI